MAIEKLTIVRIGPVRTKQGVSKTTGKPYSFNEVGIQTNERGAQWVNFSFNGVEPGIEVGKTYDLDVTAREYVGKNGPTIATNAKFPKKERFSTGMSEADQALLKRIHEEVYATRVSVQQLMGMLKLSGTVTDSSKKIPGTSVEYPKGDYPANPFGEEDVDSESEEEPSLESLDNAAKQ